MSTYVIFDVEIHDMARYQTFMQGVKPALEAAAARYGLAPAFPDTAHTQSALQYVYSPHEHSLCGVNLACEIP